MKAPSGFARGSCEAIACRTHGLDPDWCTCTWQSDLTFTLHCACTCRYLCPYLQQRLLRVAQGLPLQPAARNLSGLRRTFTAGLRATRQHGLTAASCIAQNKALIRDLNIAMRTSLHSEWCSLQVIRHGCIPQHIDQMDKGLAYMITLEGANTTLEHTGIVGGRLLHQTNGVWIAFDPQQPHQVIVDGGLEALSIVAYSPKRDTSLRYGPLLRDLAFPVTCDIADPPPPSRSASSTLAPMQEDEWVDEHIATGQVDGTIVENIATVRFPDFDAGTGQPINQHAPSWTIGLDVNTIASMRTGMMMFLLSQLGIPTHQWSNHLDVNQTTADALLCARSQFLSNRNSVETKSVWYAVLERDIGPAGSSGRFHFRDWLRQQESSGWTYPLEEEAATARWRAYLHQRNLDMFMPTPLLAPPLRTHEADSDVSEIGDTLMPLPGVGTNGGDGDSDDDHTFTFDPMHFPPTQQMRDVALSPSSLPELRGGAIDDDAEYQKTLKRAVAARPKQISAAQVKLLTRGVPGLLNKMKKATTEEQLSAVIQKAAADMGLVPKAGGSQSAQQSSMQQPKADAKSSSGDGSAQQRSKSATLPRKDREGSGRRSNSTSSSGNRVSFEDSPGSSSRQSEKPSEGDESPPFHSLCAEEWSVPVLDNLLMGKPGVVTAWSQKHAQQIAAACAGTKQPAAFIYSSPIQTIERVTPVAFLAKKKQDGNTSLFHAFLHQLGPATMPVQHTPCSTHVKRNSSVSTAVMIVDFSDSSTPQDCNVEDLKSVRSWLSRLAQSTSPRLTLVDTFHLTQSTCGTTVKIRVMADQVEAWMRRGTPARYANVEGYIGITVKQGETWGAIFAKDQADKAAVALGKPPGQTYKVTGLPIDMPAQELTSLLTEMKWTDCQVIEYSRRLFKGTATWLVKAVKAPPVTSMRLSHSESHQVCALTIELNKTRSEPKAEKAPAWMTWSQRMQQPLAPPPAEHWKQGQGESNSGTALAKSPRSRLSSSKSSPIAYRMDQDEEDALDESMEDQAPPWAFEVEQQQHGAAAADQRATAEPAGKKPKKEPTRMEKMESQLEDLNAKFERMMAGLHIIHQQVESQAQQQAYIPSAGAAPDRLDEVM
eukprot:6491199-Amphidinium_carterae.2